MSWETFVSAASPAEVPAAHALPDAQYIARGAEGRIAARCALWWRSVPPLRGETPGVIGHYAAADGTGARELLAVACGRLHAEGCTLAVGPMNGNTWFQYRLVTDPGTEPPFFLEPFNPPEWPGHFTGSGFHVMASYFSALSADLAQPDARALERAAVLSDMGVTVRDMDLTDLDGEMGRIHAVSLASFRQNLLYTPLPLESFAAQYARLRDHLDPGLVMLAEHQGRTVGFIFAIPDLLEQRRTSASTDAPLVERTIIIKTVAILPERRLYSGLGSVLVARTHARALQLGFSRAIHALIHESNHSSRAVSERTARVMRRYALFARRLAT